LVGLQDRDEDSIDRAMAARKRWEKDAHVDWEWKNASAFMAYVSREMSQGADGYEIF
jgi:hypothetical protein